MAQVLPSTDLLTLIFEQPQISLIDEIDKMSTKDQAMLINLMETGSI
jgi:DNA replicative helicase MCM subunit Mcm2 (Cdc46/Mcm family)